MVWFRLTGVGGQGRIVMRNVETIEEVKEKGICFYGYP